MVKRTLKAKVALYLALGLTAALVVFTVLVVRHERDELLAAAVDQLNQLSEVVIRSTRFAMLENRLEYVHKIIEDIAADKSISRIRIISKEGIIVDSTHAAEVGSFVDRRAEGCLSCHQGEAPRQRVGDNDRARIFSTADGERMLATMQVIRNEPSCYNAACHVHLPNQSVLGVVDIVYPLDEIDMTIRSSATRIAAYSLGFVLIASLCVGFLVHRLVYLPLRDLESGAKKLAAGNLDEPIPVRSADEFGQLAGSFNAMTAALRETQNELRESARTLEQKVDERTQQLRAAETESVQREKLAAVGLLASGIAHELNNPLTGVLTFSYLIREKLPAGSPDAEDMDLVIRETKRCASIIRRLLDFARQKAPEKNFADLSKVVEETVRFIERPAHLKNTDIVLDLAKDLPCLWVDENQVKQVIMNMLVNAQQAIDAGGTIVVQTRVAAEPIAPEPGAAPVPMVEIAIIDSGCGIPEKDLQRIFDPFFTSKEVGKGTGLGLSVSHGIVKAHGGTIKVESAVGKGSVFRVYLPIDAAEPERSSTTQAGTAA
jgi:two-component system, NtrC family, sensor kinase